MITYLYILLQVPYLVLHSLLIFSYESFISPSTISFSFLSRLSKIFNSFNLAVFSISSCSCGNGLFTYCFAFSNCTLVLSRTMEPVRSSQMLRQNLILMFLKNKMSRRGQFWYPTTRKYQQNWMTIAIFIISWFCL